MLQKIRAMPMYYVNSSTFLPRYLSGLRFEIFCIIKHISPLLNCILDVIYQTRETVKRDMQTPRR